MAMIALEKIVIDTRKKEEEEEEGEEGGEEAESIAPSSSNESKAKDGPPVPLGVQLLEYEQQNEIAARRASTRLSTSLPFNATSTRSIEKKVKARIERVNDEIRVPSKKPKDPSVLSMYKAVDKINRMSITLDEMNRHVAFDREDLTQIRILEKALEESFPEVALEALSKVPESHSAQEEDGEEMKAHWKAFEIVESIMDQEIEELGKLSGQHSKLMDKIFLRVQKLGSICKNKMESMQKSLQSYRGKVRLSSSGLSTSTTRSTTSQPSLARAARSARGWSRSLAPAARR